jgi:hypothetical protein
MSGFIFDGFARGCREVVPCKRVLESHHAPVTIISSSIGTDTASETSIRARLRQHHGGVPFPRKLAFLHRSRTNPAAFGGCRQRNVTRMCRGRVASAPAPTTAIGHRRFHVCLHLWRFLRICDIGESAAYLLDERVRHQRERQLYSGDFTEGALCREVRECAH